SSSTTKGKRQTLGASRAVLSRPPRNVRSHLPSHCQDLLQRVRRMMTTSNETFLPTGNPCRVQALRMGAVLVAASLLAAWSAPAVAQSVCLPSPRLLTIVPMGGQAGTQVEVTISGEELEEADEL